MAEHVTWRHTVMTRVAELDRAEGRAYCAAGAAGWRWRDATPENRAAAWAAWGAAIERFHVARRAADRLKAELLSAGVSPGTGEAVIA